MIIILLRVLERNIMVVHKLYWTIRNRRGDHTIISFNNFITKQMFTMNIITDIPFFTKCIIMNTMTICK